MPLKKSPALILASLFLITSTASAQPDPKQRGTELLRCWDNMTKHVRDQYFRWDMEIQDKPSGGSRTLGMKVWEKNEMRLVHFVAPANVAGMKVLTISRSQMYVYLKGFNRIRRITSHTRDQSLFGSDYSYDDQSTVTYGALYEATLVKEEPATALLRLTRKKDAESSYGRIHVTLRKEGCVPLQMRYFNEAGKHVKTETRSNYNCEQKVCNAALMKMVNHAQDDHWTVLHRREWKLNVGVSESKFSRRALQRAE